MIVVTSIISTIYPYVILYLVNEYNKWWSYILMTAALAIGAVLSIFVKEDLRKTKVASQN